MNLNPVFRGKMTTKTVHLRLDVMSMFEIKHPVFFVQILNLAVDAVHTVTAAIILCKYEAAWTLCSLVALSCVQTWTPPLLHTSCPLTQVTAVASVSRDNT